MEGNEVVNALVYIICPYCKGRHRVSKGVIAPIYKCPLLRERGQTFGRLQAGDDVEYYMSEDFAEGG